MFWGLVANSATVWTNVTRDFWYDSNGAKTALDMIVINYKKQINLFDV
jgi:hypothetical protein